MYLAKPSFQKLLNTSDVSPVSPEYTSVNLWNTSLACGSVFCHITVTWMMAIMCYMSTLFFIAGMGECTCRLFGDKHVCQGSGHRRQWNSFSFAGNRWAWDTCSKRFQHLLMSSGASLLFVCLFVFSAGSEDDAGHFEIDIKTGDIRTTQLFTHNAEPYYTLKITAKDSGIPPQEDTAVVHVQVQYVLHWYGISNFKLNEWTNALFWTSVIIIIINYYYYIIVHSYQAVRRVILNVPLLY